MANLKFKVGGVWNQIVTIKGDKGDAGDALPVGGTAGQLLIKQSSVDSDATWQNNPSAPAIHNHDDRYYTEDEMFDLLLGKANTLHGHGLEDIVGLTDEFATKAEKPTNETTATNGQILTANGDGTSTYKNLLMPKNWIINGMFDVWQRNTTQTTSGYGSDDRWSNANTGSTKTHSQQAFTIGQIEVPNNPIYFSRTIVTSVTGSSNLAVKLQNIEDVTKLAGKTVTVSFWAKADANKNMAIGFLQNFGSGGSSTIDTIGVQKLALTTSWQRFTKTVTLPSVSGKIIGIGSYTQFRFWFDAGSSFDARTDSLGHQSGTFDIANVSLVEGSVAVEYQNQPYFCTLLDCLRYYWRMSGTSNYPVYGTGIGYTSTVTVFMIPYVVPMRTLNPIITFSNLGISDVTNAVLSVSNVTMPPTNPSNNIATLDVTHSAGGNAYRPYRLLGNNSASSFLAFDCEL